MKPKPLLELNHFTVPVGMECSLWIVAPRRSVRGIKLVVGETRIGAPRKGCRGLTQVEFDAHSMAGAESNSKRRCGSSGGNENGRGAPPAVVPEKKTRRFRCRAPTGRSSAASRIAD